METLAGLKKKTKQVLNNATRPQIPDDGSIWPLVTQPGGVIFRRGDESEYDKEQLQREVYKIRIAALALWENNRQLPEPPCPVDNPLTDAKNLLQWCIKVEQTKPGTKDNPELKLDDLDNKIIELYQLAERESEKQGKKIRPPGGEKIATIAYNTNVTQTKLSKTAINNRISKLRAAGLIDEKSMKEMTNYIEPGASREENDN